MGDMEKQLVEGFNGLIEGHRDIAGTGPHHKGWGGTVLRRYIPVGISGVGVVIGGNHGYQPLREYDI